MTPSEIPGEVYLLGTWRVHFLESFDTCGTVLLVDHRTLVSATHCGTRKAFRDERLFPLESGRAVVPAYNRMSPATLVWRWFRFGRWVRWPNGQHHRILVAQEFLFAQQL
ncbi:hypothetical protein MTO96_000711 [Rhipicephalus appendiculatus]